MMPDLIGQTLGGCRILEQVGQGGMAVVYKAYQPSVDREVAVKVLPPHFSMAPGYLERFEREARLIAKIEHPHILPIYDYGQESSVTFLVMRYLDHGTLADRLGSGPIVLSDTKRILTQVAGALDYAHRRGVVHRDVKPSNVLFDEDGNTFLADFGIARMVEGTSHLTGSALIGTPIYMAPEVGLGQPADARSDVYALGVMLFQMTIGRAPYDAETPMAVILKHIHERLPLPRELQPSLPPPVERVILKALAKEPDNRYQTAAEFAEALTGAIGKEAAGWTPGQPSDVAPPVESTEIAPLPTPTAPKPRRAAWPLWAGLGTLALVVLVVLGVWLGGALGGSIDQPATPSPLPLATEEVRPSTPEPTTRPIYDLTLQAVNANTSKPLAGAEVTVRNAMFNYEVTQVTDGNGQATFEAVPDDRMYVSITLDGEILLDGPITLTFPDYVLKVYVSRDLTLQVVDANTGTPLAGAEVTILNRMLNYEVTQVTNASGQAVFSAVPDERMHVSVMLEGKVLLDGPVTLTFPDYRLRVVTP